ncbi:MAG: GNAT family N-acetyltransferase [Candidatus Methylomirabilota bacterium]
MAPIIRQLGPADRDAALAVINTAAHWYQEFLPSAEVHDPEMTAEQWMAEAARMTWHGVFVGDRLVGVIGLEYVRDAALIRHGYILPECQRQGIGNLLREHLETEVRGASRIIIGTYRGNFKARRHLEKAGYTPSPNPAFVLRTYYDIPEDRFHSSLTYEKLL